MTNRELDTLPAGNTRDLEFSTVYPSNWSVVELQGDPIDADEITGAKFMLKSVITSPDADAKVSKTLGSGIAKSDGKVTVSLTAADTKDLQGKYYGTLRLFLTGDKVLDWFDTEHDSHIIELPVVQGAVEAVS